MITKQYTLPDWEFIGGTTQLYEFKLKSEEGHVYDVEGATADVAFAPFVNQEDVLTQIASIRVEPSDEDNGSYCLVKFELPAETTKPWSGKYVYQITVRAKNDDEKMVVAAQKGRMFVHKNLDINLGIGVG